MVRRSHRHSWLAPLVAVGSASLALSSAPAQAASLPDLSLSRVAPASAYAGTSYTEMLTVTNSGTAPTPGIEIDYMPGWPGVALSGGPACAPILRGHSGRGGGVTRVGWACTETVSGGLATGASVTAQLTVTPPHIGAVAESLSVLPSPNVGQLNLVSHSTSGTTNVVMPPSVPVPPTMSTPITENAGLLQVAWVPDPATAGAVTSSTVTATIQGSGAPSLTVTVPGQATSATIGPVEPNVTYSITVASSDILGRGAASAPVSVATGPSTVPPSAPTALRAFWSGTTAIASSWTAPDPGDSPIDWYYVVAVGLEGDPASFVGQMVAAPATSTYITVPDTQSWGVIVIAHNAAGWGAWSAWAVLAGQ